MPDVLNDTLHSWQNFYFMIGGASAALIGLMFVALSLGINLVDRVTPESFAHFATPSVFYFVSALMFSALMLVPTHSTASLVLITLAGGIFGLMRTGRYARYLIQMARRYQDFDTQEWLGQVILPLSSFVLILASALCLLLNQIPLAFFGWWIATICLLMSGISNTWSMVLWIVSQGGAKPTSGETDDETVTGITTDAGE